MRLCHELGDDTARLIVLGGLVPAMLTRDAHPTAPEHLGTTDVDILLITHVDVETNLGAVGEGAHAPNESILIDRIAARTALLAKLVAAL